MMTTFQPQPLTVHAMDWQPALAELAAGAVSAAGAADAAIEAWAERCRADLEAALPGQQHLVLAHPGAVREAARVYLSSPQAQGWLHSPLAGGPGAPHWSARAADALYMAALQAQEHGFCAADCGVLGMMGALASIEALDQALPLAFTGARRHFPLLGAARAQAFQALPRSVHAAGHPHGLYAVMGDADWVLRALDLGVRVVQLRVKHPEAGQLDADVARCAEAAARHGALLYINDHWQAALRHVLYRNGHGIHGVHLGQEDLQTLSDADLDRIQLAGLRLGVSTHSLWELARALRVRPSYVACGPVHATTTKDMPWVPLGDANVAWWAHLVHDEAGADHPALPLVAIGGMTPQRARAAAAAGADLVAVVSALTTAADPAQAVAALREAIAQGQAVRTETPAPAWPLPTLVR